MGYSRSLLPGRAVYAALSDEAKSSVSTPTPAR
jgi:hypothetical protein